MKLSLKLTLILVLSLSFLGLIKVALASDLPLNRIALQMENKSMAWFVDPKTKKKIYLKSDEQALGLIRDVALGISNKDIKRLSLKNEKIKDLKLAKRLAGMVLLQVEAHGEAWYVNPGDYRIYYLGKINDLAPIISTSTPAIIPVIAPVINATSTSCNFFIYGPWSSCVNKIQDRQILSSFPKNCIGGGSILAQSCDQAFYVNVFMANVPSFEFNFSSEDRAYTDIIYQVSNQADFSSIGLNGLRIETGIDNSLGVSYSSSSFISISDEHNNILGQENISVNGSHDINLASSTLIMIAPKSATKVKVRVGGFGGAPRINIKLSSLLSTSLPPEATVLGLPLITSFYR